MHSPFIEDIEVLEVLRNFSKRNSDFVSFILRNNTVTHGFQLFFCDFSFFFWLIIRGNIRNFTKLMEIKGTPPTGRYIAAQTKQKHKTQ